MGSTDLLLVEFSSRKTKEEGMNELKIVILKLESRMKCK